MKKICLWIATSLLTPPLLAAPVTISTTTIAFAGQNVTANVAPARTPGYYRLVYDGTTKKIKTLVYSVGVTETVNGLYAAETYAEIQSFSAANQLTGLPKDPNG